jgi:hypothetical protein
MIKILDGDRQRSLLNVWLVALRRGSKANPIQLINPAFVRA